MCIHDVDAQAVGAWDWVIRFVVRFLLFAFCCLLSFCVLFFVFCLLYVVCCLVFGVCCLLFVVCLLGLRVFAPQLVLFLFSPAPSPAAVFTGIITRCCFHWHYHRAESELAITKVITQVGGSGFVVCGLGFRVWGLGFRV